MNYQDEKNNFVPFSYAKSKTHDGVFVLNISANKLRLARTDMRTI
jgi:hypothetical protein